MLYLNCIHTKLNLLMFLICEVCFLIINRTNFFRLAVIICFATILFKTNTYAGEKIKNDALKPLEPYYIAIIIDDFGNSSDGIELYKNLEVPFTAAVMPSMPSTDEESLFFSESENDVILHMPMEAKTGDIKSLGESAIYVNMSDDQIRSVLIDSLDQIHGVIGLNNHMGSRAMEEERIIRIIMEIAKERDLIVIDSRTTPKALPKKLSKEYDVTVMERDKFLDAETLNPNNIRQNIDETLEIAKANGYAIAIGHVGAAGGNITAEAINEKCHEIESQNIKFVTISELKDIIKNKEN